MPERGPLNSAALKNRFPEIYREFFSKCQIVVSAPHFFTWSGEYVGYFGGMMTLQKIPLRLYVGLELYSAAGQEIKIEFEQNGKAYTHKERKFVKDQFEHLAQSRLLDFIANNTAWRNGQHSVKIHLLSEIAFGGSGSSGALCAALAVVLSLLSKRLTVNEINAWDDTNSKNLLEGKKTKFREILLLSWKMLAAYRGKENSAAPVLTALLSSQYPIFYQMKEAENLAFPLNIADNTYAALDHIDFIGGRLNDDLELNHNHSWPVDFGLIYLGEPRGTAPYTTEQLQDEMEGIDDFCFDHFSEFTDEEPQSWQAALKLMNFLSCQILYQLGQVLKSGSREDSLRGLLRAVDKHQILFMLLGVLPGSIDSITSMIHHQARKLDDLGAGLKSVSTTKKDIILFVLPHGRVRDAVIKQLPKLEKELGVNLFIGYASWIDGLEDEACKVEHYLADNIYSEFISSNAILIKEYSSKGKVATLFLPADDFQKRKSKVDLLLEENGRIHVRGQLLGSAELHSSKVTAEVLKTLLTKLGQEISNRTLPSSSYSQDRYEMQGKITGPLVKAFEQKTKKKLPIIIKGSVTDFSLKLEGGDYTIWIKSSENEK